MPITGNAPDFSLESTAGKDVTLSRITAMFPALLVFFSAGDEASEVMMPYLAQFCVAFKGADIEIIGVTKDSRAAADAFAAANRWSARVVVDPAPHSVFASYAIRQLPAAVLVGNDNQVIDAAEGADSGAYNRLSRSIADLTKWKYTPVVPGEVPEVEANLSGVS